MNRSVAIELAILLWAIGCDERPACTTGAIPDLTATPIEGGPFSSPILLTTTPGDPDALFVVQQGGTVLRIEGGVSAEFLNVADRITSGGEQGLLGLAFHPDYGSNGRFFVYYTATDGTDVVAEYHRDASDPDVASNVEDTRLVAQPDNEGNHNGGMIAFGHDRYLYVAIGDGGGGADTGSQHDPETGNGQSLDTLFGKLLRLDVDASDRAYVAAGNPFEDGGGLPQIWAYGLRNPWRFSFDRSTGDLFIGDVGQSAMEEIDFRRYGDPPPANFGWRAWEGTNMYDPGLIDMGLTDPHVPPIFTLDRAGTPLLSGPAAIIGGYVYRGNAIPELRGAYVFGDAASPDIGAFHYCPDTGALTDATTIPGLRGLGSGLSSFGEDQDGELYLVYLYSTNIYRIEAL